MSKAVVAIHYHNQDTHSIDLMSLDGVDSTDEALGYALQNRDKKYDGWSAGAFKAITFDDPTVALIEAANDISAFYKNGRIDKKYVNRLRKALIQPDTTKE